MHARSFFVSSFIRLADYLIVNTMHVLAVNSVATLLNHLKEQLANTPTVEEIQMWNVEPSKPPTPVEEQVRICRVHYHTCTFYYVQYQ